jgi:hypothetical protein
VKGKGFRQWEVMITVANIFTLRSCILMDSIRLFGETIGRASLEAQGLVGTACISWADTEFYDFSD